MTPTLQRLAIANPERVGWAGVYAELDGYEIQVDCRGRH